MPTFSMADHKEKFSANPWNRLQVTAEFPASPLTESIAMIMGPVEYG